MIKFRIVGNAELIECTSLYNVLFINEPLVSLFNSKYDGLDESPWALISNDKEFPILDSIQIKVNIPKIGSILAVFDKTILTKENKDALLAKLIETKEILLTDPESRKDRVIKTLEILNSFNPFFTYVCAQKYFDEIAPGIREYIKEENTHPVFISLKPIIEEKPVENAKEEKVKKEKTQFSFKNLFDRFVINLRKEGISYSFNLLYVFLLASVTLFMFVFFAKKSTGYAAIFIAFMAVFTAVLVGNMRLFMRKKSFKRLTDETATHVAFHSMVIFGIGLGIMTAYLVSENLLKSEDVVVNYSLDIPLTIFISFGLYCVALIATIILELMKEKRELKNPKKNTYNEDNE